LSAGDAWPNAPCPQKGLQRNGYPSSWSQHDEEQKVPVGQSLLLVHDVISAQKAFSAQAPTGPRVGRILP
jgi:hypothetical protein